MKLTILGHNKQILALKNRQAECYCGVKNSCSFILSLSLVTFLQNNFTNNRDHKYKYYLGLAETTFKEWYYNHKSSFKNEKSKIVNKICCIFKIKEKGTINSMEDS